MFLYVTGHGLLDKKLEDAWGNVFFKCKTVPPSAGPKQEYTLLTDAAGRIYGRVDWQGCKPTCVWLKEHSHKNMRELFGKYKREGSKITYDSSPRKLKWVLDSHNVMLESRNRNGKVVPILDYVVYKPGAGGAFADAVTLADDLCGLEIDEVLVGWLIMERIRTFEWPGVESRIPHLKKGEKNTSYDWTWLLGVFTETPQLPPVRRRPTRKLRKKRRPQRSQHSWT